MSPNKVESAVVKSKHLATTNVINAYPLNVVSCSCHTLYNVKFIKVLSSLLGVMSRKIYRVDFDSTNVLKKKKKKSKSVYQNPNDS